MDGGEIMTIICSKKNRKLVVKSCVKLSVEIGSLVNYQIFTKLLGMDDEENEIKPKQRTYTRQFELGFREEKEH